MSKSLILVAGQYGSGKTTYANGIGYPVIHIDDCFQYGTGTMDYNRITEWKDKNSQHDTLVLDAYVFPVSKVPFASVDPNLSKLKESILPIEDINIKAIYTTVEELYECQRSTDTRIINKRQQNLTEEMDRKQQIQEQKNLINIFTEFLEKGIVSSVEYIFREGPQYKITDKNHFLKILLGV
jgi:hypothetical protein